MLYAKNIYKKIVATSGRYIKIFVNIHMIITYIQTMNKLTIYIKSLVYVLTSQDH